jgi:hypothetical protein
VHPASNPPGIVVSYCVVIRRPIRGGGCFMKTSSGRCHGALGYFPLGGTGTHEYVTVNAYADMSDTVANLAQRGSANKQI